MPVSPDPDLALRLAKAIADLYGAAVLRLVVAVARRIARGIDRPGWAEQKLLEVARLRDEAQKVVDRLTTDMPGVVREAVEAGHAQGLRDAETDLTDTERRIPVPTGGRGVDQLIEETVTGIRSTHLAILRQVDDTYRSVVAEVSQQVVAGADTRLQAAQRALDRFGQRGITGFVDRSGRRWELETYAEMAVRTAVGRAQVAGALDRLSAAGRDLVIVSDAPQECVLCRPWEGRVLSITGQSPGRPTVATARLAGLWHVNCRHSVAAWIPGLSRAMGRTADPAGDRARQEHRRLERGIRMWKRRAAAAVDPQARKRAERHARQWQARLRAHLDETGLIRRPERERLGAR